MLLLSLYDSEQFLLALVRAKWFALCSSNSINLLGFAAVISHLKQIMSLVVFSLLFDGSRFGHQGLGCCKTGWGFSGGIGILFVWVVVLSIIIEEKTLLIVYESLGVLSPTVLCVLVRQVKVDDKV